MSTKLINSLYNGYIDKRQDASPQYIPKMLTNDYTKGEKVLITLLKELNKCESFYFCVAFLSDSGAQVLISTLMELEKKGIKGIIIVSEYQKFTQPKALEKLLQFKNIELRIMQEKYNMHAKGYIFRNNDEVSVIIGSSNLTQNALCVNKEWNIKVVSKTEGSYCENIFDEFNINYNNSLLVTKEFIREYEQRYLENKRVNKVIKETLQNFTISPNKMQEKALDRLKESRKMGNDKALIISSTGTGKTILSAFDVKAFKPKKFLFIIHREQIANDALNAYKKVLGNIDCSILSGGNKKTADYVFATIQTLSKDDVLSTFKPDEFDYIVYDEVHRICRSECYGVC